MRTFYIWRTPGQAGTGPGGLSGVNAKVDRNPRSLVAPVMPLMGSFPPLTYFNKGDAPAG
jgi:hypothetical protein